MKKRKTIYIATGLMLASTMLGCTANKNTAPSLEVEIAESQSNIEKALLNSAKAIQSDLNHLLRLAERSDSAKGAPYSFHPPKSKSLHTPLPMLWRGPIEPAVETVARAVGWSFKVTGKKPVQPIMVQISSKNMAAYRIIENCGAQAGAGATVVLNESIKQVEIKYFENGGF